MAKQTIGDFLATQRKAKGYTQQQVSDMLGISNRTLSSWEQGRAYPDILTLPALAEIYGVTADEILNGERSREGGGAERVEISEKSQEKLNKRKLAVCSNRITALTGAGVGGAVLMLLFAFIGNFAPVWLIVLVCAVAVADVITVLTLLFVFDRSTLTSAGIFTDEPLTDTERQFIWKLRGREVNCVKWLGLIWTVCGIVSAVYLTVEFITLTALGTALFAIPLVCGILMLAVALILYNANVNKYGQESDRKTRGKRGKLMLKTLLFTLIPLTLCVVLLIVTSIVRYPQYEKVYEKDRETFLAEMHTVAIPSLGQDYGVPSGSYYIDFNKIMSEDAGKSKYNYQELEIEVADYDENGKPYGVWVSVVDNLGAGVWSDYGARIPVIGSDELIFDMHGYAFVEDDSLSGDRRFEKSYIEVDGNTYRLINKFSDTYFNDCLPIGAGGMLLSVAVGAVVYLILRKKV